MSQQDGRHIALTGQRAAREISLLCTTTRISPRAKERLSRILAGPVDWRHLLDLAAFQAIMPLIIHNLVTNGFSSRIPPPYLQELKRTQHATMYQNLILSSELAKVLTAFNQHGVQTICLKGTPLAESLYGNPCLRSVGDMDILVHPEDIPKAAALLADLGYKQRVAQPARNHPFHGEPFWKEASSPLAVELHWHLDDSKLAAFPQQPIWHRAQPLQFEGTATLMLSPEDNLLFLANHLTKHDSHQLKLLTDIAELLKKHEESLDWTYITTSARTWQIAPAVYYALRRARELTGAPVSAPALRAMRPGAWRWWLLDLLVSQETLVSPIRDNRLRSWTAAVARSLMMKGPREMLHVLSRQEGRKKGKWLRTIFWTMAVFATSLGRYRPGQAPTAE